MYLNLLGIFFIVDWTVTHNSITFLEEYAKQKLLIKLLIYIFCEFDIHVVVY